MRRFLRWLLSGFEPFNPPTPLAVLEEPTEPLPASEFWEVVHITTTNGVDWCAEVVSAEGMYAREPLSWIEAAYTVAALEQGQSVAILLEGGA